MAKPTLTPKVVPRHLRTSRKPYMALAAMQVLDVALTWMILTFWASGAQEGNPVIAFMMDGTNITLGLLMALILKISAVYLFWACQTGVKLVSAFYGLVIVNNLIFAIMWLNHVF